MQNTIRLFRTVLPCLALCCLVAAPVLATDRSHNVVIIGGPTLDTNQICSNGGSTAANVATATYGGCLTVTGSATEFAPLGGFPMFTFTAMSPSSVTPASLAGYDTAVLNMASSAIHCSSASLNSVATAALTTFLAAGKKLIDHL
jgi:hypothetical protein